MNVISGNHNANVWLYEIAGLVSIQGNFIGPDKTGTNSMQQGPGTTGVEVQGSDIALIGGAQLSQGNVISGNVNAIVVGDDNTATSQNNLIQGNWIGYASDGKTVMPNSGGGLLRPTFLKTQRNAGIHDE